MKTFCQRLSLVAVIPCLVSFVSVSVAAEDHWFVSVYAGQYSDTALNEIVRFNTDIEDSHVYVLSVGKALGTIREKIGMELEAQAGFHTGIQGHHELNLAFTLRWLPFPWDDVVDTSFAFGNGLSWASEDPPLEIRESDDDRTAQWLYYILVEFAFSLPEQPQWDLFVRVHHRSSVFGVIDDLFSGSNFVGLGIRYKF